MCECHSTVGIRSDRFSSRGGTSRVNKIMKRWFQKANHYPFHVGRPQNDQTYHCRNDRERLVSFTRRTRRVRAPKKQEGIQNRSCTISYGADSNQPTCLSLALLVAQLSVHHDVQQIPPSMQLGGVGCLLCHLNNCIRHH